MLVAGRPMRCLRCGGVVLTEPDMDGIVVDLKCMECGRSKPAKADFFSQLKGTDDLNRSKRGAYPVWIVDR